MMTTDEVKLFAMAAVRNRVFEGTSAGKTYEYRAIDFRRPQGEALLMADPEAILDSQADWASDAPARPVRLLLDAGIAVPDECRAARYILEPIVETRTLAVLRPLLEARAPRIEGRKFIGLGRFEENCSLLSYGPDGPPFFSVDRGNPWAPTSRLNRGYAQLAKELRLTTEEIECLAEHELYFNYVGIRSPQKLGKLLFEHAPVIAGHTCVGTRDFTEIRDPGLRYLMAFSQYENPGAFYWWLDENPVNGHRWHRDTMWLVDPAQRVNRPPVGYFEIYDRNMMTGDEIRSISNLVFVYRKHRTVVIRLDEDSARFLRDIVGHCVSSTRKTEDIYRALANAGITHSTWERSDTHKAIPMGLHPLASSPARVEVTFE